MENLPHELTVTPVIILCLFPPAIGGLGNGSILSQMRSWMAKCFANYIIIFNIVLLIMYLLHVTNVTILFSPKFNCQECWFTTFLYNSVCYYLNGTWYSRRSKALESDIFESWHCHLLAMWPIAGYLGLFVPSLIPFFNLMPVISSVLFQMSKKVILQS